MVWIPYYTIVATIVVLISVALIAIIYMIGRALSNDKMTAWATDEFYQAFASILIIAFVVFIFEYLTTISLQTLKVANFTCTGTGSAGTCQFTEIRMKATGLSYGGSYNVTKQCGTDLGNACHIAIAQSKVDSMYDLVRFHTADKMVSGGWIRIERSLSFKIKKPWEKFQLFSNTFGVDASFQPFSGLVLVIDSYNKVFELLTKALEFLKIHSILFTLIEKVIFPVFLVAGIIMRALSPFRKLGGLLIAIAVGLYFIYPFMFILQALILSPDPNVFPITFEQFQENAPETTVTYQGQTETVQGNILTGIMNWPFREVNGEKVDVFTYYLFGLVRSGGDLDTTAFLGVWILVPEVITVYTLVIFIMGLSPFFGGDVGIAGLQKLL